MMCVDGSNNFGGALCIMYEYLLSCIVFHEKEYKDKLCCAASYIEIYMICMCMSHQYCLVGGEVKRYHDC